MYYLLILLLILVNQNYAQQNNSDTRRAISDSFDVNIGAGYGVGPDESSRTPSRSSIQIIRPENYQQSEQSRNIASTTREPRILRNFTPLVENTKDELQTKSQNRIYDFTHFDGSPSIDLKNSKFKRYQVHETFNEDDKLLKGRPSLIQLQKVINGVDKPHSKIVEVIKVPAVYEIHVQSDSENSGQKTLTLGNLQNTDVKWEDNSKHKPIFKDFSTKFSEEYLQWLKDYYNKKEDDYVKVEKYHTQNPTTLDFQESFDGPSLPEINEHLNENEVLDPVLAHHYKHIGSYGNKKYDKEAIRHNTEATNKLRYSPWLQENKYYNQNPLYAVNNFKRETGSGLSSYRSSAASYSPVSINRLSETKKSLDLNKYNTNLDLYNGSPFKVTEETIEFSQPQALHEVPPPSLGKYPHSTLLKGDILTSSNNDISHKQKQVSPLLSPNTIGRRGNSLKSYFSQQANPTESDTFHGAIKTKEISASEAFSSTNKNQEYINGKQTEAALSPHEIVNKENVNKEKVLNHADYRRSGYEAFSSVKASEVKNPAILVNHKDDNKVIPLTVPNPDSGRPENKNTTEFNKKSDDYILYRDYYDKKIMGYDLTKNTEFWEKAKPVYKSNFHSIYPKKTADGKKNLLHSPYSEGIGNFKGINYGNSLKDTKYSPLYRNNSRNKPTSYVIYIRKKIVDHK